MATLCASKDFTILTFSDTTVVLSENDINCSERLIEHKSPHSVEDNEKNEVDLNVCSSISNSGDYFTCCCNKNLYLWSTKDWNRISQRPVQRSVSALVFSPNDDYIAVADKSGDVYLFSVENSENQGELILGHISMLLDILITPDCKYIITSDRDEKIRISCFPNAYNIQSFCLGHEEFVTSLNILPHNENVLASGSGDGSIRFWDYVSGRQLVCHFCNENESGLSDNNKPVISKIRSFKYSDCVSILCVQLISLKGILVYSINCNVNISELKCIFKQLIQMDLEPWCFCLNDNFLWTLKQNVEECLSTYNFCKDKNEFIFKKSLSSITNIMKKHSFLKIAFSNNRNINTLYKRRFDNVQEYLKRKMIRMEMDTKKAKNDFIPSEIT